jgi:hypothetical protein
MSIEKTTASTVQKSFSLTSQVPGWVKVKGNWMMGKVSRSASIQRRRKMVFRPRVEP